MAVLTIISVWVLSLFATAMLGWGAGRRASRLTQSIPARCNTGFTRQAAQQTNAPQDKPTARPTARRIARPTARPSGKRNSSVFDDMPAVEAVRAEAKAILEQEKLWETPGILANFHQLTLERGATPEHNANRLVQRPAISRGARQPLSPQTAQPTLREPIYA